ncbi:hypothetical protein RL72_03802 [Microbacterium azadirachtae]|uniref:Uncharacterized protein n=1 Tax=Microbacterium azadirachtae TaxID=582680 RepID=A0A0F0K9G0_9MICO|nr:DUF6112 family protein [Microbacterium azadirachtae]KJL17553.1 hypothetical protein RL72_03802 [Microbacterium azadirachtae]
MIVLVVAALMLLICAIAWGHRRPNGEHAPRAPKIRHGAFYVLAETALARADVTWVNFLFALGARL